MSDGVTPIDAYRNLQALVTELCSSMSPDEVAAGVPTCPDWTSKDVLAHVVGIPADIQAGRTDGVGTDAWTSAQVASRVDNSVAELLAEWDSQASFLEGFFDSSPDFGWALVGDLVTHEHDLRLALGRPGDQASAAVVGTAERYADQFIGRVTEAELGPVAVMIDGTRRGSSEAELVLSGSAFDVLRAATGRRSQTQVEAMDWTGDPGEIVTMISAYGSPSATDIHE